MWFVFQAEAHASSTPTLDSSSQSPPIRGSPGLRLLSRGVLDELGSGKSPCLSFPICHIDIIAPLSVSLVDVRIAEGSVRAGL